MDARSLISDTFLQANNIAKDKFDIKSFVISADKNFVAEFLGKRVIETLSKLKVGRAGTKRKFLKSTQKLQGKIRINTLTVEVDM